MDGMCCSTTSEGKWRAISLSSSVLQHTKQGVAYFEDEKRFTFHEGCDWVMFLLLHLRLLKEKPRIIRSECIHPKKNLVTWHDFYVVFAQRTFPSAVRANGHPSKSSAFRIP
jgi:hypothetical protein